MNATQIQHFRTWRIHSTTRPGISTGLLTGFGQYTSSTLEALTSEQLGFYADEQLLKYRGEEVHDEQFLLQGGNSFGGPWVDIKPIMPAPGENPQEPHFGDCMRCSEPLEESEYAIGDVCSGCTPAHLEEHERRQAGAAERDYEAEWLFPGDYM